MGQYFNEDDLQMATQNRFHAKKKTYGYKERNEEKRGIYLDKIKNLNFEDLVYLDESGIDDNEVYEYAWGKKGERIYGLRHSHRKKRLSIISSLNCRKLKAPFVFEGSCTKKLFEMYVEQILLPTLRPGQTVIMDNASFHKGNKITKLIEDAGCDLLYLPPYSPDFNPIEHYWTTVKYHIKTSARYKNQIRNILVK